IDRGVIAPDDLIALAAPCLRDRLLDAFESTISRQDIGEREEARLHDRVDATAQAALTRDPACIDREKAKVFRDHDLLHLERQAIPYLVGGEGSVEKHGRSSLRALEHIDPLEEGEMMARDEVSAPDEIGRADRAWAEAEMRHRHRAGLLRVVDEIALDVILRRRADDL